MESRHSEQAQPAPPVLVVGLVNEPSGNGPWVWELLDEVEPRLRELIALTDGAFPMPEFRKASARHHRLTEALPGRRRVVLVTAAEPGETRGGIARWHCGPGRLRAVRQAAPLSTAARAPLNPAMLEEELAREGLDLIRLPAMPARGRAARRGIVAAGLLGLVWDIVRSTRPAPALDRAAA